MNTPTYKPYAGIGSRTTPQEVLDSMKAIASFLEEKGYTLRSGAAQGADTAFENGVRNENMKEIYLPWKNFNGSQSSNFKVCLSALEIAQQHHQHWNYLSNPAMMLMGRNTYQIMGRDLDLNSQFVVCWTPDGCESYLTRTKKTGGTGQAIAIASKLNIPIFNLKNAGAQQALHHFILTGEYQCNGSKRAYPSL